MPAVVLGIMAYFYLTDWPTEATWLRPEQRQWIDDKLREEKPAGGSATSIGQALRSRVIILLATVTFLIYFAFYSFTFWFPTMLKRQSGYSDINVGLLGVLPYIAGFLLMQANGWHSDKRRERRWHAALPTWLAAAALLGLAARPQSMALSLILFTLVGMGIAYLPVFWAVPTEILSQSAAAAAIGMINAVGSVAGFAGPYLFGYLNTRTGSFAVGLGVASAAAFAGGLLMLGAPRSVPAAAAS
jgi:sugar phosphate permease